MADSGRGIVIFGDVLDSRADAVGSAAWLRHLSGDLDAVYGPARQAEFGFTQGDELQGLLDEGADPLLAVLRAALDPGARPMRWAIVAGAVNPGAGPATERTGAAFLQARAAVTKARAERDGLVLASGDPASDAVLSDLGPVLAVLLADLTERQREIVRGIVVEGLRQADVADRLGISRPTVSVAVGRARLREIVRLAAAIRTLFGRGVAAAGGGPS
ncbi:MAG: sigma factor-like helix-turn-helix DNA-binding protein [Chloroflexota bacterium]